MLANNNGKNLVTTEGDVTLARNTSGAFLLRAENGGVNEIAVGGDGDVRTTAGVNNEYSGWLMFAGSGGTNKIATTGGDIIINSATDYSSTYLVHSQKNSSNYLYSQQGKISFDLGGVHALMADGAGAIVSLKTDYDGSPTADSEAGSITIRSGDSSSGDARDGGRLELETRVGDIYVQGSGMSANTNSSLLNIEVKERGGYHLQLYYDFN